MTDLADLNEPRLTGHPPAPEATIVDLRGDARVIPDDRDREMIDRYMAALDARTGPREGDFVVFAGGTTRRLSHIWTFDSGAPEFIQTSDGGSFYLGDGYVSFSGGLHPGLRADLFRPTGTTRLGWAWTFHHNQHRASNAVHFRVPFRLFTCPIPAN